MSYATRIAGVRALIAGATTIGEREAAEEALQRLLQNRPAETAEIEAATVPQKKEASLRVLAGSQRRRVRVEVGVQRDVVSAGGLVG